MRWAGTTRALLIEPAHLISTNSIPSLAFKSISYF